MGFGIFMLIMVLLIPLTMLFFGWLLFRRTPKEINYVYGYRTKRSMMNEETWRFANQYFGKAWYLCGLISVPLSVIAITIVFGKGPGTVGMVGGIITMLQMLPLIGAIVPTESELKKNFDENGKRR
ncbi:SdpI family protein [Oribacterium sinus]|uniref:SdpI family protein n=1 Tax=Oribacterium sinus TaxID=237576 RepID=UPI0028EA7014|nr:SdpI family protein [Oribacterium sinus]